MKPYYEQSGITIYHGDCRELMRGLRADAIVTDPPYGETSLTWDRWPMAWPSCAFEVAPVLWCFGSMRMFMAEAADLALWNFGQDLVWEKQNGSGFTADRFLRVHEHLVQFYRGPWADLQRDVPREKRSGPQKSVRTRGLTPHRGEIGTGGYVDDGFRLMRSVIFAPNLHSKAEHPTEKPESVIAAAIHYSVPVDGCVLDCFVGSGTTLIAAKRLGRKAIGIEIDEKYCEVAANRLRQDALPLAVA